MVIPALRSSAIDPTPPGRDRTRPRGRPDDQPAIHDGVVERPGDRTAPGRSLVVLIGGHAEQGDDGAPLAAAATLLPTLPRDLGARLGIRRRPRLEVEDVAALTPDERFLLVDAASGPPPGTIITGDLADLRDRTEGELGFVLRSVRHDTVADLIESATDLRGAPIEGWFVAMAGHRWGFGTSLSPTVRAALPAFREAIGLAIRHLATDAEADPGTGD